MLKTGEMLIMLIMLISFFEKVVKTGEMLIMLIIWGLTGTPPPKEEGGVSKSPDD